MGYEQVLGQISEQQQKIQEEQQKAQQEKQKAQEHIKKLEEKAPIPERIQKKELARTSPAYRVKRQQQIKKAKKAKEELKEYQKELTGYEEELTGYEKELEEQEGTVKEYKQKGYEIEETPEGYQFIKRTTRKVSKKVTPKTAPITIGSQPKQRYTIPQLQKIKKLFQVAKSRVSGPLQRVYDKYIALADEKIAELKKRPTVITRLEETIDKIDQPQIKQALERVKTQLERQYESKLESIVTSTSPMVIDTYYTYKKKHPGATMPDYAKYTAEHMRFIKSLDPSVLEDVQQKRQIRKQTIQDLQKINITPSTYTPDIQLTLGDQAIRAESYEDLVSGLVERQQTQIQKALTQQKQTVISDYRKTGSIPNWFASEVEVPEVYQSLGLEDKYKQAAFEQVYGISKAPEGFVGPTQPPLVQFQQTEVQQALKTATPAQTSKYLETLKKEGQFKDPTTGKIATFQELKEKGIKDLKLVDGQLVFVPMTEVELGKKKYDTLVQSYRDAGYSKDDAFRLVNTQLATVGMMTLGISDIANAFGSEVEKDEMEQYLRGVDKGFWDTPEEFVQQRYGWGKKVQREAIQRLKDNLENPPVGMDKALYTLALKDEAFRTAAEKLPEEIKKRTLAEHALSAISPLYNIASTSYGRQVLGSEAMVHGVYIPAITMGIGTVASAATKVGTEALAHVAPKLAKAVGYALPAGLIGYGGYESGKVIWEAYQPGKVTLQTPSGEFYEKELGGAGAALERAAPIALAWASAGEGAKLTQKYSPQLSRAGQRIAQKGTQAYWRAQSLFSKATPRTYQTLASIRPKMSRMIQAKTVEREGGLFRPEELTDIYQDWQTSDYVWPEQHPLYQKKFPIEYAPTRPWERVDIMPSGAGKGTGISLAGRTRYGSMSDYFLPEQPIPGQPHTYAKKARYLPERFSPEARDIVQTARWRTLDYLGRPSTQTRLRVKPQPSPAVSDITKAAYYDVMYGIPSTQAGWKPKKVWPEIGERSWVTKATERQLQQYQLEKMGLKPTRARPSKAFLEQQFLEPARQQALMRTKTELVKPRQGETDILEAFQRAKQDIAKISYRPSKTVRFYSVKEALQPEPKVISRLPPKTKTQQLLRQKTDLQQSYQKGQMTQQEYLLRKKAIDIKWQKQVGQKQILDSQINKYKLETKQTLATKKPIALLPPHVDQDAEYIKKIQETWTPQQLQKAIKTGKIDKKLVRKMPVLMEYWNPAEGKLIRVVLKKSLPEHKKTLEKIKETVAEYPQALEKWKFEAWEKQHVKPTARVKSIFEPKRAAFYKPHIDAYKDLRSKETYEKAKKLTDEERKKRIEEQEKELVYPEMSYIAEYEIYGKKYRATDKQAAKKLEKLKEYEQKTIQQRQDAERKIYQGLTKEQELKRRQLNYDAARKERQVKQELNELVKERKIERQAVAVEEWGSLSYKPMENYWKKEEISTMKIEKEKQKGTSLEEMEKRYGYKPISIKPKPKLKLEELESKDDLLSGGYMQVQRLKKKQKLETTYSREEILQGQKMSEQIKQRQKELERTQERIWKESEIKRKQQALIKKAQEVKDKLSKSTTTFQEQRKLQTLLQYLNLVIRKLGDTEGLKKLTDEELGAVIVQAENLEKDIKAGQGEKNVSVIRQAQGLRSKLAQIQRQQQKMLQLQSAAEELIKKTIQRLISGQAIGVISPIQKQRMAVILRPKLEQEILPIYKEVPDYMYTAETPPVRPVTPILLGATEEGPEKERKKRKPLRLEKGYEKRKYEVPNIWKAGGKRPSWAQRPIKKPSIIKKPKTFTITGAKA